MNLSAAPPGYDRADEARTRDAMRRADGENHKRGRDVEVGAARLILTAPNGSRWALSVSNAGAVVFTAL
jgi:hypothetical protein